MGILTGAYGIIPEDVYDDNPLACNGNAFTSTGIPGSRICLN